MKSFGVAANEKVMMPEKLLKRSTRTHILLEEKFADSKNLQKVKVSWMQFFEVAVSEKVRMLNKFKERPPIIQMPMEEKLADNKNPQKFKEWSRECRNLWRRYS